MASHQSYSRYVVSIDPTRRRKSGHSGFWMSARSVYRTGDARPPNVRLGWNCRGVFEVEKMEYRWPIQRGGTVSVCTVLKNQAVFNRQFKLSIHVGGLNVSIIQRLWITKNMPDILLRRKLRDGLIYDYDVSETILRHRMKTEITASLAYAVEILLAAGRLTDALRSGTSRKPCRSSKMSAKAAI